MKTKDMTLDPRKDLGLSWGEFTEKLFAIRQAVSWWENGEVIPNTGTFKLIAGMLHVSVDHLLGQPVGFCQSYGMTLEEDGDKGMELDGSKSGEYCTFCFQHGKFTEDISMEELIEHNLQHPDKWNESAGLHLIEQEARVQLVESLPALKRWKTNSK